MRKVFLENLPRWEKGSRYFGKINWKGSIGCLVKFIYDDISGILKIVDYDSENGILKIQYNNDNKYIRTKEFKDAKIGRIIGKKTINYIYKKNEIITNVKSGKLKILDCVRIKKKDGNRKCYRYICLICGFEDIKDERNLKANSGCAVCSGQKVLKGYNDLWTTVPNIAECLYNKEDGYLYTKSSNVAVDWKCPNCGEKIKSKQIKMVVQYNKLSCPKCSDGISYPEKFFYSFLKQSNIEFDYQKHFEWSKGKIYDFYIPDLNCIIEINGDQHYKVKKGNRFRNLNEEQKNDQIKRDLAIKNKITYYISIDCSSSDINYMKKNILKSELKDIINFENVNWLKCHEDACKSFVKIICNMWEQGYSTTQISSIIKLSRQTIIKYLKQGALLKWCNYSPQKSSEIARQITRLKLSKKIVQLSLNGDYIKEYASIKDAARELNIDDGSVTHVCKGKYKYHKNFKWMYKDDYDKYIKQQNKLIIT